MGAWKLGISPVRLGVLLLWKLSVLLGGSAVEQANRTQDSVWAEQAVVTYFSPSKASNDGSAVFQANFTGPDCPTGTVSLVFPKGTPAGKDVVIVGDMDSKCQTAVFRAAYSEDFQSIQLGVFRVQLQLGPTKRLLTFADGLGSNSSAVRTNTTTVTITKAATADILGQCSAASRMRATVTLNVGLDGPAQLPTIVGLRVWDSAAVEVEPATVVWQPGEHDSRNFTLQLTRAAPSGQVAAWAELVRISDVLFREGSPPRVEIRPPRPSFYAAPDQVLYRTPSGSDSNGSSIRKAVGGIALSTLGSSSAVIQPADFEVRRAGPSPFLSTLQYKAVVLQAVGCGSPACATAVFGSGLLRIPADTYNTSAQVYVNWTALPAEAILSIGLQLVPIDNADVPDGAKNVSPIHVYGTVYGTCPAGTVGPWPTPGSRAPGSGEPALMSLQGPSALGYPSSPSSAVGGAPVSQPGLSSPPLGSGDAPVKDLCNDTAMLGAIANCTAVPHVWPMLAACTKGEIILVTAGGAAACDAGAAYQTWAPPPSPRDRDGEDSPSTSAPQSSPSPSSSSFPSSNGGRGDRPDVTLVELQVPFGQDAALVFVPLASAEETVVLLNTTCDPDLMLIQPTESTSLAGVYPWAGLVLPKSMPACFVLLQVYGSVWSEQSPRQQQQSPKATQPVTNASSPVRSPGPAMGPAGTPPRQTGNTTSGSGGGGGAANSTESRSGAVPPLSPKPASGSPTQGSKPTATRSLIQSQLQSPGLSPSTSPSARPPPSLAKASGGASFPILSMAPLRILNVTLRPRSDPDIFSAGALALYLSHHASGRCLPLCGLPQPMLYAAASRMFEEDFDLTSQLQLDAAASALVQAIRGADDAVAQLQAAPANGQGSGSGAGDGGGSAVGLHRSLIGIGRSVRRRLAALLAAGWQALADQAGTGATAVDGHASVGAAVNLGASWGRRAEVAGSQVASQRPLRLSSRRRVMLGNSGSGAQQSGLAVPESQQPARPPAVASPAPLSVSSPGPVPSQSPPSGLPSPPVLPSTPVPGPGYPGGPPPSAGPDGFDLVGGRIGTNSMHVLFNPEFREWCHAWEVQVVDLSLLTAPYEMALEASSLGVALEIGGADNDGSDGGPGERTVEVILGPDTLSELQQLQASRSTQGADLSDTVDNCLMQEPVADRRVAVSLVAPDGITTAPLDLHLFVNYSAAAALAAMACQNANRTNSLSDGTSSNSSSGSGPSSSTTMGDQVALPGNGPVSSLPPGPGAAQGGNDSPGQLKSLLAAAPPQIGQLWSACRPCGPGYYSDTANATACSVCGPGTASSGDFNKQCTVCAAGTFTTQPGSSSCRPCYAGTYAPRPGSTACTVCPVGTTSLTDGASVCVVPRQPEKGDGSLVVSFQVVLNISSLGNISAAQAANAAGIDAPKDSIFMMLIAADTAAALRISITQVRVSLMEVSPSSFLVNVSATMPLTQRSNPGSGSGPGSGTPYNGSPASPEVDADTLINRLLDNPDGSFPRTKEATGGSLQVQHVQRQVVMLDDLSGGVNVHGVLWPTLAGTAILAVVLGFACHKYCRRRRARAVLSLPPITDALGRLCSWKSPTSPAVSHAGYGRFSSLELQDQPTAMPATARMRGRNGSKVNLPSMGMTLAADSAADMLSTGGTSADLDAMAMMYTREALAAPRI